MILPETVVVVKPLPGNAPEPGAQGFTGEGEEQTEVINHLPSKKQPQ